jgi:hypothetical protein
MESKSSDCFFYLHPKLGNKDLTLTSRYYGVANGNPFIHTPSKCLKSEIETLRGWLKRPKWVKWLPFVKSFNIENAVSAMPAQFREAYCLLGKDEKMPSSRLVEFEADPSHSQTVQLIFVKGDHHNLTVRMQVSCADRSENLYLKKDSKRFSVRNSGKKQGHPLAFPAEEEFMVNTIRTNFERGQYLLSGTFT